MNLGTAAQAQVLVARLDARAADQAGEVWL
jgi:hypothetical protein